jgi:hypothetical protein
VSRSAACSDFFSRQLEPLSCAAERRRAHPGSRRCGEALPQCLEGRIGLVLDLAAQEGGMVFEGALLAARMGLRGTAPAAAKPTPQFFHARETDTEALRHRVLCLFASRQRVDNPVTQSLGVWFHIPHYALNVPDMQLQAALGLRELFDRQLPCRCSK